MGNCDHAISLTAFEKLCDIARSLNEWTPPEQLPEPPPGVEPTLHDRSNSPWADFNRRGSWADTGLEDAGWQWVHRIDNEKGTMRRPGKEGDGVSATVGIVSSEANGWPLFWNFSTSVAEFDADAGFCRSYVFAVLKHGGDLKAATRALAAMGYGDKYEPPTAYLGPPMTAAEVVNEEGEVVTERDDGIRPDHDFATNADLKKLGLDTKWAWNGWLQIGVANLLAAQAGVGKTRWVADLVRRVHTGEPWPDGTPTPQWDSQYIAMWVAADQNHAELMTLSESFGFGERIAYSGSKIDPLGGITLETMMEFTALEMKIKAAKPLFLVVDTAGGATGKNLAKQEEARAFFAPLSAIAARRSVCLIIITHLNSGATVLGRRAEERVRCVIRISAESREQTVPRRVEVVKSNNMFPPALGMVLGESGNTYTTEPPDSPEQRAGLDTGRMGGGGGGGEAKAVLGRGAQCMEWLKTLLQEKPMQVGKVLAAAEEQGFSTGTVYKSMAALNVTETESPRPGQKPLKWWSILDGR